MYMYKTYTCIQIHNCINTDILNMVVMHVLKKIVSTLLYNYHNDDYNNDDESNNNNNNSCIPEIR